MKNFKIALAATILSITLLLGSCAKNGIQGPAGNANVIEYFYKNDSVSFAHDFIRRVPVRFSSIDSAVTLFYYYDHAGAAWYQAPGLGAFGAYQTRYLAIAVTGQPDSADFILRVYDPSGGTYNGSVVLDKVKIIVIPASTIHPGKKDAVDYSDYKATMKYLGLKEN